MAVRELVKIDEERCDGCGDCIVSCAEGAIQLVDGKARLVSDVYCDGLGACLGHCPQGAISIERAEARPFDEAAVERHLESLEAGAQRKPASGPVSLPMAPRNSPMAAHGGGGCPGSRSMGFDAPARPSARGNSGEARPSTLRQWPVQLHLLSPVAPYFQDADVLLAADCVAFAVGDFHRDHMAGKGLAIACPKLDEGQEAYVDKLVAMIDEAGIRSLNVMIMEVPCCGGLVRLASMAAARASREVPITCTTVGVRGEILAEQRVN